MRDSRAYLGQNGTFLPMGCIFARNAAEKEFGLPPGLAGGAASANVDPVVVAPPQWAKTQSLIRYPSPWRRSCAIWRRPPLFCWEAKTCGNERRFAHWPSSRRCDLDYRAALGLSRATIPSHSSKGTDQCDHISSRAWPSVASWASRPVAIRFPSRRFSAQARVRAPLRCWTATLPLVRLSGPRATWPTARPTHTAVTEFTPRRSPARKSSYRTIGAIRAGGLFMSCRRAHAPGQEPKEGT